MKIYLLALLAACSSKSSSQPPPAVQVEPSPAPQAPPEKLGVVFERVLVSWSPPPPLFGPDGSVTVDDQRWSASGAYVGNHAFGQSGVRRPVAVAGSAASPHVIALAALELEGAPEAPPAEDNAWLVTAAFGAKRQTTATSVHHKFLGDIDIHVSPDGASLVMFDRTDVVVRSAENGAERARYSLGTVPAIDFPDTRHACWVDNSHVAWIGTDGDHPVLRVGALDGTIAIKPLARSLVIEACDPAGAVAVVDGPGVVASLDLATGHIGAAQKIDLEVDRHVAIGARGERLAIATLGGVTLYRRHGNGFEAAYTLGRPLPARRPGVERIEYVPAIAFSHDGARLAVVDHTLVMIGDISAKPATPPVPTFAFELPKGFTAIAPHTENLDGWSYAQLPEPSGASALPAVLVHAASDRPTDIMGLVIDHADLPPIPADTATDAEMTAFAKQAMGRWFSPWQTATLDKDDDTYTIHVGRTNGMRWFETRELQRDGCEPYDGYTRVVLDTHVAYVVRALTVPGGAIDGWLAPFLDIPFGARVQTALRRGPRSGPC